MTFRIAKFLLAYIISISRYVLDIFKYWYVLYEFFNYQLLEFEFSFYNVSKIY